MQLSHFLGMDVDGRPLYRYRLTDDRYDQILAVLSRELRFRRLADAGPILSALFCVFAAEWWRREHDGVWAWRPIQDALGIGIEPWSAVTAAVARGLDELERPLLRGNYGDRAFLVTVACEGGLPLAMLRREGANVRGYCRDVLEHLENLGLTGEEPVEELEQIAARYDDWLPKSLRRDIVHRLVGELVGRAWALRQTVPPGERDPVLALDREVPDWRERLPIVVSDDDARELLHGLMVDVTQVARGGGRLRVRCQLVLGQHEAQLRRHLDLPATVAGDRLRQILGGRELPDVNRLLLTLRSESGDTVRVGALGRAGDDTWASQPLGSSAFVGTAAEGLVSLLLAWRGGIAEEASKLDGASPLGALPWTFRPSTDGAAHWDLVAVGSVRRREPELLVAVGAGDQVAGDGINEIGATANGRRLFQLTGTLRATTQDGEVVIRASQLASDAGTYALRGEPFERVTSTRTAWKGMPTLVRVEGARVENVALEVADDGRWRPAAPTDVGDLRIRSRVGADLVFSASIRVVPRDLEVRLEIGARGSAGGVSFRSQNLEDAHIPEGDGYRVQRVEHDSGFAFLLEATGRTPPAMVPVTLLFGFGRLQGRVPFPIASERFQDASEQPLNNGHDVHVKRLGGIRAVGLSPRQRTRFRVTLTTQGGQDGVSPGERSFDLDVQPSGEHVLDLRDVQGTVLELLDAAEHLDAVVRIELWEVGAGGQHPRLNVRRYDWTLERDDANGDVFVRGTSDAQLSNVIVEVRPFVDVTAVEALPFLLAGEPRWRFDPASRAGGPWLVTAREAGWYRCRPISYLATGPGTPQLGMRSAFEIGHAGERAEAIAQHLAAMCEQWTHPDWKVVDDQLRLLGDLPAATFDLVRCIASNPQASAIAALRTARGAPADVVQVLGGFEELTFLWDVVPLDCWRAGFDLLYEPLARIDPEQASSEIVARAQTLAALLPKSAGAVVLVALHHWARTRRTYVPPAPKELPIEATFRKDSAGCLLEMRSDVAKDLVRQRGQAEVWPRLEATGPLVPPALAIDLGPQTAHRRQVLDAPVLAARCAVGAAQCDRATTLFLEEVRAFAPSYFQDAFLFTFFALVARAHGV